MRRREAARIVHIDPRRDALSTPPGYTDTPSPLREPSGVNSQEFDIDAQDFPTSPTNLAAETTP